MYRYHLQPKILSKERIRDRWSSIEQTSFFSSLRLFFLSTLVPYYDLYFLLFLNLHFVHFYYNLVSIDNKESFNLRFFILQSDMWRYRSIFRYRVIKLLISKLLSRIFFFFSFSNRVEPRYPLIGKIIIIIS